MRVLEIKHETIVIDIHNNPAFHYPLEPDQQAIIYNKQLVATFHEDTKRILIPLYDPRPGMAGYVQEIFDYACDSFKTGEVIIATVREEESCYYGYFGCVLIVKHANEKELYVRSMDLRSIKGKLFRRR